MFYALAEEMKRHIYRGFSSLLGIRSLTCPDDFAKLASTAIERCNSIRSALNAQQGQLDPHFTLRALDAVSNEICSVIDVAELVRNSHHSAEYRRAAEEVFGTLAGYIDELNSDQEVYHTLVRISEDATVMNTLSEEERIFVEDMRAEYENEGITSLSGDSETLLLKSRIMRLETSFINHAENLDAIDAFDVGPVGNPKDLLHIQAMRSLFPHSSSSLSGHRFRFAATKRIAHNLLSSVEDESIRKQVWMAWASSPASNIEVLGALIKERQALARHLGFPSYSHKVLSNKIVSSPENVFALLDKVSSSVREKSQKERRLLLEFKLSRFGHSSEHKQLMPWDSNYLINQYHQYINSQSSTRNALSVIQSYLSLSSCLNSFDMITQCLFGIRCTRKNIDKAESLAESISAGIYKYELSANNNSIGVIYMDLFARSNKISQSAHFNVRCGCLDNSALIESLLSNNTDNFRKSNHAMKYQLPVVALTLSLTPAVGPQDPLLSLADVEVLYHEFGHALHSLLSRTTFQHLAGTRGGVDFAEIPSHLFEHFCRSPAVVEEWARHCNTGERIPSGLLEEALELKNMFSGMETQNQILFSAADQIMFGTALNHSNALSDRDCYYLAVERTCEAQACWTDMPVVNDNENRPVTALNLLVHSHLVSYGGSYYSYIYAKQKSKEIWDKYFEANPLSSVGGKIIWDKMLKFGAAKKPKDILDDLLST